MSDTPIILAVSSFALIIYTVVIVIWAGLKHG